LEFVVLHLLLYIIVFTALGGVLSVLAASAFLWLPEQQRQKALPPGVSFAIGALLTGAFCGLLPQAFAEVAPSQIPGLSATILAGILLFFVLEKLLVWRHCHTQDCEAHGEEIHQHAAHSHEANLHGHQRPAVAGTFIRLGDSIHNFVDGILIAAAFMTDIQLGIITSIAVAAHEIPQEVGDFAILLNSGFSKNKALLYNVLSSLTTVIGGILAYFSLEHLQKFLPYFLVLAAASFIYIAVADLIPSLHQKTGRKESLLQISYIVAGVLLILLMQEIAHSFTGKKAVFDAICVMFT
jgi:zinc and cadmium transporter